MEMQQIRYFLAVCDKGSFTRAAQATYVAQPSLTQAIKKLEDELGGELFSRDRNGCRLTALGRLIEPSLREIVRKTQAVKAEAVRFSRLNTVPLRIGVMTTIAAHHLGVVSRNRRKFRHPNSNPATRVSKSMSFPSPWKV